jgi:hypothetical protein
MLGLIVAASMGVIILATDAQACGRRHRGQASGCSGGNCSQGFSPAGYGFAPGPGCSSCQTPTTGYVYPPSTGYLPTPTPAAMPAPSTGAIVK